jgi:hypothetical protein
MEFRASIDDGLPKASLFEIASDQQVCERGLRRGRGIRTWRIRI